MDVDSIQVKINNCLGLIKRKEYDLARSQLTKHIETLKALSDSQIKQARVNLGLTEVPDNGRLYHPKIITLLDYRAKVYLKLHAYDKAYADSKSIIKYQPYSAKGYLVCGHVLELENEFDKALYVYNLGASKIQSCSLENIGISERLLKQLTQKKDEMQSQIKKRKINTESIRRDKKPRLSTTLSGDMDPFRIFPIEILSSIFKSISTNDILKRCFLVSKLWRFKLLNMSEIYRKFLFNYSLTVKNFMLFLSFLKCCKYTSYAKLIETLLIQNIISGNEKFILRKLFDSAFQIRFLQINLFETELYLFIESLHGSHGLLKAKINELKLGIHVTPFFEEKLLIELPNLKQLLLYLRNGKDKGTSSEIILNQYIKSNVLEFKHNLENNNNLVFGNLTNLEIIGYQKQNYSNGKIPFFNSFKYNRFVLLKSLIIVGINFTHILRDNDTSSILQGIFRLSELKELFIEGCTYLSIWHVLKNICLSNSKLESFTFRDYSGSKEVDEIQNSVSSYYFENLTHLDLYDTYLSFRDLMRIIKSTRNLKALVIGGKGFYKFPKHAVQLAENLHDSFKFYEFFDLVPNLVEFRLPDGGHAWDDNSMKMFRKAIVEYEKNKHRKPLPRLRILDLSFSCVTGHGLLEFFAYKIKKNNSKVKSSIGSKIRRINSNISIELTNSTNDKQAKNEDNIIPFHKLNRLILDGVENISSLTLRDLVEDNYVEKIENSTSRAAWPLYGKNLRLIY